MNSAQQSEVKAWEEEISACEHTLMLQQDHVPADFQGTVSPDNACEVPLMSTPFICALFSLITLQSM